MNEFMEEYECRICKCGEEEDHLLFKPCLCSGSIQFVHQDCLEAWLNRSQKESCEVCRTKYQFVPQYADDTPEFVPARLFIKSSLKLIYTIWVPCLGKFFIVAFFWLIFFPFWAARTYQQAVRNTPTRTDLVSGLLLIPAAFFSMSILAIINHVRWTPPLQAIPRQVNDPNDNDNDNDTNRFEPDETAGNNGDLEMLPRVGNGTDIQHEQPQGAEVDLLVNNYVMEINNGSDLSNELKENSNNTVPTEIGNEQIQGHIEVEVEPELDLHADVNNYANWRPWAVDTWNKLCHALGFYESFGHLCLYGSMVNGVYVMYMFILICGPFALGDFIIAHVTAAVPLSSVELVQMHFSVAGQALSLCQQVNAIAIRNQATLRVSDLLTVMVGYAVIGLVLTAVQYYIIHSVTSGMRYLLELCRFGRSGYQELAQDAQAQAQEPATTRTALVARLNRWIEQCNIQSAYVFDMAKLLYVVHLRLFLLPLSWGVLIIYIFNGLFLKVNIGQWALFLAVNAVGAVVMAWVVGVTYALILAHVVMYLREALHPDILANFIRPQGVLLEELEAMVVTPSHVLMLRQIKWIGIHLILLFLLVYCPLQLCAFCFPRDFSVSLRVCYFCSALQLPLELVIAFVIFNSILAKWTYGACLHEQCVGFCRKLGLTRYLFPYRRVENSIGSTELHRLKHNWHKATATKKGWAWENGEKGDVELSIVTRVTPTHCMLRVVALGMISWVMACAVIMAAVVVPFSAGRAVVCVLQVPDWLQHDPVTVLIGLGTCYGMVTACQMTKHISLTESLRSVMMIPGKLIVKVATLGVMWWLMTVSVGLAYQMLISSPRDLMTLHSFMRHVQLCMTWLQGSVCITMTACFVLSGALELLLCAVGLGGQFGLEQWTDHMVHMLSAVTESVRASHWTEEALYLTDIQLLSKCIMVRWSVVLSTPVLCLCVVWTQPHFLLAFVQRHFPTFLAPEHNHTIFNEHVAVIVQWTLAFSVIMCQVLHVAPVVCKIIHNAIRDDNYVISRKLLNFSAEEAA